jgi:hypothetical protein
MAGESLSLITRRFIDTLVPIVYVPAPLLEAQLEFRVELFPPCSFRPRSAFACEAFAFYLPLQLANIMDMPARMYGVGMSRWARGVLSIPPGLVRRLTGDPLASLLQLQSHQHREPAIL